MTSKQQSAEQPKTSLNEGRVLPVKQLQPPMPKVAPPLPPASKNKDG